jgi:hypothetical protein
VPNIVVSVCKCASVPPALRFKTQGLISCSKISKPELDIHAAYPYQKASYKIGSHHYLATTGAQTSPSAFPTNHIVTCIPTARQRLSKHIPAEANTPKNKTSIARQRINKHVSLKLEAVFSVRSVQSGYKEVFGSR